MLVSTVKTPLNCALTQLFQKGFFAKKKEPNELRVFGKTFETERSNIRKSVISSLREDGVGRFVKTNLVWNQHAS